MSRPVPDGVPAADWPVDARLARRLLREQFPELAGLPLRRIGSGWDTVVYRLGPDLSVRIPRRALGSQLVLTEQRWLPGLAPLLPLPVPVPVRCGQPGPTFGHPWSICRYVPGRPVVADGLAAGRPHTHSDRTPVAPPEQLATFLRALHRPAPSDAPVNPARSVSLEQRDVSVRDALTRVPAGPRPALTRLWQECLTGDTTYAGPRPWIHGDLHGLNILRSRGRISAIVDFGDLCAGDPATDLAAAWLVLDRAGRRRFRRAYAAPDEAAPDEAAPDEMWRRGRGWATLLAIMFLAHSEGDSHNAAIGHRALAQLSTPD